MQSLCKFKGHIRAMFAFFEEDTELEALHCDRQHLSKVQY